jgi:hypothetical protein
MLGGDTVMQECAIRPGDSHKSMMHDALLRTDFVVCVLYSRTETFALFAYVSVLRAT